MIALALLIAAPLAALGTALPTGQRQAADRLLAATGVPSRRDAQIDDVVTRVLMFTSPACAVAAGNPRQVATCAAQHRVGRALVAKVAVAKPELIAAITDIQERAYASRLSVAEMDAVTAFARTPVGSRFFAAVQPAASEAAQASTLLIDDRIKRFLDELEAEEPQPGTVVEPDK